MMFQRSCRAISLFHVIQIYLSLAEITATRLHSLACREAECLLYKSSPKDNSNIFWQTVHQKDNCQMTVCVIKRIILLSTQCRHLYHQMYNKQTPSSWQTVDITGKGSTAFPAVTRSMSCVFTTDFHPSSQIYDVFCFSCGLYGLHLGTQRWMLLTSFLCGALFSTTLKAILPLDPRPESRLVHIDWNSPLVHGTSPNPAVKGSSSMTHPTVIK